MTEGVNATTVSQSFNSFLHQLWPDGINYTNVLLLLTDGAAYVVAAVLTLVTLYDRMVHVTCLAHGLHRVCETIRLEYADIDALIASAKEIFVKVPDHVSRFHFFAPNVPLSPKPVLTRWGTWLSAALYYS